MIITRIVVGSVLLALATVPFAATAADRGANSFEDCSGLQLSLEGASHSYWIAPEKGRVVLVRACGPVEADCDHDVITVWDGDGRKIFEAAPFLDVPEMSDGHILDAALRTPDRLVVSAIVGTTDTHPVLAEYDVGSGSLLRAVATGPVRCLDLAGDDDGLAWCLGIDPVKNRGGRNFDLVHRFEEAGALAGSTVPRSAFHPTSEPLRGLEGRGSQRGGFLPGDGPVRLWLPAVGELLSFDDDGRIVDRLTLPTVENQQRAHLASSPDGAVYAMLISGVDEEPSEWTQGLYRLSDDGTAWAPLEGIPEHAPMQMALVGADDGGLVLLDRKTLALCRHPNGAASGP